jgi:uncharacterized protein (DUF1501 family)
MQRRQFLGRFSSATSAALLGCHAPGWAQGVSQRAASVADRILILIELKGGNDGLNTVVPYADPAYLSLRNTLAIRSDEVIKIDSRVGLHPQLQALVPLWEKGELAVVQGVGYPQPNLSHFRSIEIWQSGSKSAEYLDSGWVTRGLRAGLAAKANFTAEGVLIGSNDFGPLAGSHAVSLNNPEAFINQSRFATPGQGNAAVSHNAALAHLLSVEGDVNVAAQGLRGERFNFQTVFPQGPFGNAIRAAVQVVASQKDKAAGQGGVPVITLTLGSFDTHQNQLGQHANLLRQLAEGMAALKGSLTELGAWDRTLLMTFSEFGRRARQNNSNGTDHGTVAPHFVAGGAVRGGLHGKAADLARLDGSQNLVYTTDFRQLYTTVAQQWWGVNADPVVRGTFEPLNFLRV